MHVSLNARVDEVIAAGPTASTPLSPTITFTGVDRAYAKVLRLRWAVGTAFFLLIAAAIGFFFGNGKPWLWILVPLSVAGGTVGLLVASKRVRAIGYYEGDDDFLVCRGAMLRSLTVVPYGRMQQLVVTSGPFLRRLGLANLVFVTAAAGVNPAIPGLPTADAERLRNRLAELGQAKMEGL